MNVLFALIISGLNIFLSALGRVSREITHVRVWHYFNLISTAHSASKHPRTPITTVLMSDTSIVKIISALPTPPFDV